MGTHKIRDYQDTDPEQRFTTGTGEGLPGPAKTTAFKACFRPITKNSKTVNHIIYLSFLFQMQIRPRAQGTEALP